ncbi:MAG: hypothetical protein K2W96_20290, partial [Gemmataceae bacterium]|nr:hypothetical protein [Gemmataceae bacterium]
VFPCGLEGARMRRWWREADPWLRAALAAWVAVLVGVCVRNAALPRFSHPVARWQAAGAAWLEGRSLYSGSDLDGYRSSPAAASLASVLVPLPLPLAGLLLRLLAAGSFVAAALWWMRRALPAGFDDRTRGIALLLMLPLSLGSLDSALVNLLVLALMLGCLAAAAEERWRVAGLLAALASMLLLSPLALAGLLLAAFPRRFALPFLVSLAALAAVPLLFQPLGHVAGEYVRWMELLALRGMGHPESCRDLWHLFKTWHVRLGPGRYELLQLAGGLGCAAVCAWHTLRGDGARHRLGLCLWLAVLWILLLGPATDSASYAFIGPPLAWLLLRTGPDRHPVTHHVAYNAYVVLLLCSLAGLHPLAMRLLLSAGMQSLAVLYLLLGLGFLAFTWPEGQPQALARLDEEPAKRAA